MAITTVSSHVVSVNAIQGTLIADNAITAVHIATNAVSGTLIADNAVTATHIAQNTITVTQIADDAIEAAKIADGVITTNHLNKAMISSQTEVTPVAGDFVLLGDTSDSNNLKKAPLTLLLNSNVDISTKLNLSGGTMTGALIVTDGSTSAPSIANSGDTNTGIYFPADDNLGLVVGGSRKLLANSTGITVNNGDLIVDTDKLVVDISTSRVGIGTTSPQETLHLFNSAQTWNQYSNIRMSTESDSYAAEIGFHRGTSDDSDRGLFLSGDGTNKHVRVLHGGNVGIGTTSPSRQLTVQNSSDHAIIAAVSGTSNLAGMVMGDTSDDDRGAVLYNNSGDYMYIQTDAAESMRIDSEKNISFGKEKVDPNWSQFFNAISGNYGGHVSFQNNNVPVTTLGNNFYLNNSTLYERVLAYPSQQFKLDHQQNFLWESAASGTAGDTFSFTEHMRLNSNGTLMVGTATNPSYAHRIFADGNSITNGIARFNDNDVSCGLANVVLQLSFGSDDNCSSASFLYMADSGGSCGSITAGSNGNNVNYNTTSDERLKKNIVDASSQLNTIKNIKVREFDWKKNDYHEVGVIAQELITLIPDAVQEGGDDESDRPFGVDYGKLTPYIIKALQEQQTIIEDLKSRIETLEG